MRQKIIGYRYVDLKTLLLSSEYRSGEDPQFLVALNGKISFWPGYQKGVV